MRVRHCRCYKKGDEERTPCNKIDRWWLRENDANDSTPVLAASPSSGGSGLAEASAVLIDAEAMPLSESARIEYCKSRGVDFARAALYVPILAGLERTMTTDADADASIQKACVDVSRAGSRRVRIIGMSEAAFLSMVSSGRCPLCGHDGHLLGMCRHLPDDLRPFA